MKMQRHLVDQMSTVLHEYYAQVTRLPWLPDVARRLRRVAGDERDVDTLVSDLLAVELGDGVARVLYRLQLHVSHVRVVGLRLDVHADHLATGRRQRDFKTENDTKPLKIYDPEHVGNMDDLSRGKDQDES